MNELLKFINAVYLNIKPCTKTKWQRINLIVIWSTAFAFIFFKFSSNQFISSLAAMILLGLGMLWIGWAIFCVMVFIDGDIDMLIPDESESD